MSPGCTLGEPGIFRSSCARTAWRASRATSGWPRRGSRSRGDGLRVVMYQGGQTSKRASRGSRQGGEESRQGARRHSGLKCSAISRRESRGPSHAPTCKSEMHRTCTRVADNRSQITASLPFPPPPPGQGQGTQHIDTPVPRVARLLQSYHLGTLDPMYLST